MSAEPSETPSLPPFLLRTDRVRAGDVLLTLGSEKKSAVIANFSGGHYSHAALCINSDVILESDGGVIDRKAVKRLGWATISGSPAHLGVIPGSPAQFALYRHPRMSDISESRFKEVLLEEMSESYGKDYSEMFRLAALADSIPAVNSVLDLYYRIEHKLRYADNVPGPFCSELVARFYERLGLPLFSTPKRPEQVSPNHLTRSNLERIEDAVVDSIGLSIQPSLVKPFDALTERGDPFASYLNWQRRTESSTDQRDELRVSIDDVRAANARLLSLMIEAFETLPPLVRDHINEASGTASPRVLTRALELSKRYISLATRLPTLMPAYAGNDWDVVLTIVRDLYQVDRSAVRRNLLLELHKRRANRASYNWWQWWRSNRKAWRVATQIRQHIRYNLLQMEEVLIDALVSQRKAEALLTTK